MKATLAFLLLVSLSLNAALHKAGERIAPPKRAEICLTMIVKNESRIIERLLESVKGIVDLISICDTGSSDNTVEIIEDFMKKHGIPGKVHHHIWKNFGHNRTLSAEAAQAMLSEMKRPLDSTYLLLLDADMVLEIAPDFDKSQLKEDSYLLMQKSSAISYYNLRLIKASLPWHSVGVTHEYWACKLPASQTQLKEIVIDDREDGGSKADKFERDLKLLRKGLEEEPDNVRYMFYLAQTYRCLRQYGEAIRWYKARIEKGSWHEEVWYSKYIIGEIYEEMGFWDQALHWYLEAFDFNPLRAEPLHKIAHHYRMDRKNYLCHLFAMRGREIPYPESEMLFVSHPVYEYQFDEELSIAAYYTRFNPTDGYAAVNRLMLRRIVPDFIKEMTFRNMLFYVPTLPNAKFHKIQFELPLVREGLNERFRPMNPSIVRTESGYDVLCRTVNYDQENGKNHHSCDPNDPTIRTRNFLLRYDRDFKLLSQQEIIERVGRVKAQTAVEGMEDCRLFCHNGSYWVTCCSWDATIPWTISQVLCKLKEGGDPTLPIDVEKFIPLKGCRAFCEKNWLPFVRDGNLYAIYLSDPFILYKIDCENGACEVVKDYKPPCDFYRFRGSSGPIEFDGGYLYLIHEVTFTGDRFYTHRLLYLDRDLTITKISKPFVFKHKGVEYCCGMTLDHDQGRCIFSIGLEDREAEICTVDLVTVRSMLEPLPV